MLPCIRQLTSQHPFRSAALAALLLCLTVGASWLWAHAGHQPIPTRGATVDVARGLIALAPDARRALDVQTARIQQQTLEERLVAPATLVAPWPNYAFATSRIEGRIAALYIQPGQRIQKGQPLAEVQSLELENLQLELLNAHNDVRLSAENLAQFETASKGGAIAGQQLIEARARHQENLNSKEIARRKLIGLGVEEAFLDRLLNTPDTKPLRSLPILSPIAGEVVHADVQLGQSIQPTEHLIDVVDLSTIWVRIAVLEKDWPRIEVGQPAQVRLAAYPSQILRGTVEVKGGGLEPDTQLATVWAKLARPTAPEAGHRLLPGMYGQAEIIVAVREKVKTVPATAVIRDGAERYVLIEEGPGQYTRRPVVVGLQANGLVEIKGGDLPPVYPVVTVGSLELASLLPQSVLRLSPEAERNIGLRVEPVRRRPLAQTVELSGAVDLPSGRGAVVSSRLPGALQRIAVDRSQAVAAGEVIAEVASMELQNLQLELLRHHLQVELLGGNLERLRSLGAAVALSSRQLRETESAYNGARQRRDSVQRKLEAVGLSADQVRQIIDKRKFAEALPIRAPIAGVIVSFSARLGQFVKVEDPLFEIQDLSHPLIRGYVSERDLYRVAVGQKARVRLTADGAFRAEGTVIRSGQVFGSEDRTLSVWVELKEPERRTLLPGMMARLTLMVAEPKNMLAISKEAVLREGSRAYVFVRGPDGVFSRRLVETGASDDAFVEIRRGLDEGEIVAVQGVAELQTGYASLK
jgi:cobalt-zinc-cadmium efflux system membrane fusion protein